MFQKFKRIDKKKGSGAPSRSRYAFLYLKKDIAYFPPIDENGVRVMGDIEMKENCSPILLYLTNSTQEYSYDTSGSDDEKTFRVKFKGNHPGTELQAMEFAKNMAEEEFLILIPGCGKDEPGKLLGQMCNPMIFTSSHNATREGDKFTFNFEQRIGSEYIYFLYGGIVVPPAPDDGGPTPPSGGFDPTKWARRGAENLEHEHVQLWREKLRVPELPDPNNDEQELAYIPTASDAWRNIPLTTNPQWVQITAPFASTLNLIPNAAGREFAGVNTKFRKNGWDGKNIFLRNDSEFDLVLKPTATTAANTTFYTFEEEQVLKAHAWKLYKIREVGGDFFLVEVVFGGAEFPEGGVEGNILEYDAVDGAKWSGRLTNAETAINAINNRTSSVVDKMLHYWDATAGKWLSSGVDWVSDKVLKLKSILFENYTIVQRDAITNLAEGRLIYVNDATFKGFQVYKNGAWVEIANGKIDKPTTSSDFTAYPYIVGLNDAGNSARFVAGNFDIISALFDSNLAYAFPNYNVTYSTLRVQQALAQTGAVPSGDSVGKACDYKSSGSTLGRQWGNTVYVDFTLGRDLIFNRKFRILTTVTTQRMFIGLTSVAPPVNQELTTMINVVGVCMIENSNKIWLIYNNATGSASLFDTGFINDVNYAYRLMIYRDGSVYKIKLIREHIITYAIDIVDHTPSEHPNNVNVITRPTLWCVDNAGIYETIIRDYGFTLMHKGYRN